MFKKLFIPSEDSDLTHTALLVARLWFGLTMLFNHGFDKLAHFNDLVGTFPDPLRFGHEASLILVILAEVGGSLLLTVGLMTRLAAAVLIIDMFVAFLMVHNAAITSVGGGENAFLYLAGYIVLAISGAGLFSLDEVIFARKLSGRAEKA
jgi:putative oxidoreductase